MCPESWMSTATSILWGSVKRYCQTVAVSAWKETVKLKHAWQHTSVCYLNLPWQTVKTGGSVRHDAYSWQRLSSVSVKISPCLRSSPGWWPCCYSYVVSVSFIMCHSLRQWSSIFLVYSTQPILKAVVNRYIKHSSKAYVCLIDPSKAFDTVNHFVLFEKVTDSLALVSKSIDLCSLVTTTNYSVDDDLRLLLIICVASPKIYFGSIS